MGPSLLLADEVFGTSVGMKDNIWDGERNLAQVTEELEGVCGRVGFELTPTPASPPSAARRSRRQEDQGVRPQAWTHPGAGERPWATSMTG